MKTTTRSMLNVLKFLTLVGLTLKKYWFAMLLPTHPKKVLPRKNYCLSENFFLLLFFL